MTAKNVVLDLLITSAEAVASHCAAPEEELERTYAPGKWTVRQMLAHVADVELINLWRFARAVGEPGSGVEVFDENVWAQKLGYATRPVRVIYDEFMGARRLLMHLIETLPDDQLGGACVHPEKGEMDGWRWAHLIHEHACHHLTQIEAAREGVPWVPPPEGPNAWQYKGEPRPDA